MMSIRSILETVLHVHEGVSVASIRDEWGEIYILDDDEFRVLKFDYLYEQSKMLRSAPHVPVFNYIKAMLLGAVYKKPGSALLLGLGGGSLVRALHCILPHLSQTVVEIRPLMIEMAMQYFGIPASEAIQIVQQDAKLYLEQQKHQHDLIFADLYWALRMDPMQSEHDFVRLCRNNLSPDGWLVVNYQERSEVEPDLICALYQHFDDVILCQIPHGNTVLYAGTLSSTLSGFSAHSWLGEIEQKLECNLDILNQTLIRLPEPVIQSTGKHNYGKENCSTHHSY